MAWGLHRFSEMGKVERMSKMMAQSMTVDTKTQLILRPRPKRAQER